MATATLSKVLSAVRNSVKAPEPNTKPIPFRLGSVNDIGEWGRQGDLYFRKIAKPSVKLERFEKFDGQLAEGNQRGSRHIVDNPKNVDVYHPTSNEPHKGYFMFVKEAVEVTHPDHGSVFLEADQWIEVTYQVNFFNSEKTRVRD